MCKLLRSLGTGFAEIIHKLQIGNKVFPQMLCKRKRSSTEFLPIRKKYKPNSFQFDLSLILNTIFGYLKSQMQPIPSKDKKPQRKC